GISRPSTRMSYRYFRIELKLRRPPSLTAGEYAGGRGGRYTPTRRTDPGRSVAQTDVKWYRRPGSAAGGPRVPSDGRSFWRDDAEHIARHLAAVEFDDGAHHLRG